MKTKKALFIGGTKSGKSLNAEIYTLKNSAIKPIYLATSEFMDEEMRRRVDEHKLQRSEEFETIEEPLKLYETILKQNSTVLIECVSIWINNMLYHGYGFLDMKRELDAVLALEKNMVFVLNDVGCGIIPDNALAREFIDVSGKLSQLIASKCDEVYNTIAGIPVRIK